VSGNEHAWRIVVLQQLHQRHSTGYDQATPTFLAIQTGSRLHFLLAHAQLLHNACILLHSPVGIPRLSDVRLINHRIIRNLRTGLWPRALSLHHQLLSNWNDAIEVSDNRRDSHPGHGSGGHTLVNQ
jgi:hypothetical protein